MADVRLAALAASSVLLTSMVIGNAFHQKQQFYPSVVHLTSSSISLAVLYLQGFVFVVLLGKLLRLIFFGQLRAIEIERLNDRGWYAVLETCMAFTLFRNDFSVTFVARFTLLLFTKAFHWLAEDRIDLMARSTMITTMFHLRAIGLLVCLCVCDVVMSTSAYHHLVQYGVTVQLVFGFEYAILLTALFGVLVKYVLYTVDARRDTPFDYKTELLLYNELVVSFIKLSLYLVFIVIMVKLYTIPIFFFRPMYSALRSFKKALFDVRMSRRAINIMNTLYEDATAQHLNSGDNVCIICREEMTPASRAKRLPCAHMFHVRCLRSWFQRQQTCPTCRLDILRSVPTPPPPPPPAAAQPQPAGNNNNNNNNNNIGAGNINNNAGGGNRSDGQNSSEQQQQQQQQPAMVPGMPLFAANLLPNIWQPFNLAAVQQQQQQQHVPGQSSGNTTSTGSSGVPPLTASPPLPPSFMSLPLFPPPPMGIGGGVPLQWPRPPAALPQLAALSLQQLQQLEASGRAAVEARVQLLADIGTLLDTAAVLMQQYSQVAPPVPTAPPPPHQQQHQQQQQPTTSPSDRETADCAEATAAEATAAEAGAAQAAEAAESASEVKAADEAGATAATAAVKSEAGAAAAKSEAATAAVKSEAGAAAAKSESDAASTSYTTAEDSSKVQMRQKRLQHFEKRQQQQEP